MFHNYNDGIYPLKSLGVVMMIRDKDYFCSSLEIARYTIQELLEIGGKIENDDTVDDSSLISQENMIKNMTIQDEDEKLHICFLTAIKYLLKDSSLLPMDLGYFFQQYVQKCVPDREKIDLKKTSYSKLSKYIKKINENSEDGKLIDIVNIKDKISIKSVDFQNKLISDFEPIYGIPNENDENSVKPSCSIYSCFISTKDFRNFFSDVDSCVKDENTPYTYSDLENLLLKYFEMNNYSVENNNVTIKSNLEEFLGKGKKLVDTPQTVESIARLLQKKCTLGYIIRRPDNSIIVKKDGIPSIRVHFENRVHFEKRIHFEKRVHFEKRLHFEKRAHLKKRAHFKKRVYIKKIGDHFKIRVHCGKRVFLGKKVHFEKSRDYFKKKNLHLFGLLNDSFVSCLRRYYASSAGIREEKEGRTGETVVQLQGNHLQSIRKFFKEKYGLEGKYIEIEE